MPDRRSPEDAMGAYWDALVFGYEAADAGLDPDLAETIRRFQASRETPPPGARERVWLGLSRHGNAESPFAASRSLPRPEPSPAPTTNPNGHRPVSTRAGREAPRPRTFARWMMTLLPTAAILLLTLALGFSALWPGAFPPESSARQPPALVRAIDEAPGGGVAELLAETTFTSEELPAGDTQVIFYRITLPPGVDLPYLAGPFCALRSERATSGAGTEFVQSGSYGLLVDNPLRVRRAGSSVEEEIPAGTEVVLGPGDAAIYPDYTVEGMIRNVGDEPMEIIGVAIVSLEGWGSPAPELPRGVIAEQLARTSSSDWPSLPAGPKSVSVWRLTLPDDTSVGPYEATGLETVRVESGTIALGFVQPGESEPFHLPMSHMAGTSIPFLRPSPGVRRTITSVGNQPAVVLALGIEPEMAAPGSLAP